MTDYSKLFDLTGKKALVVGAGAGIGQATAQGFAAFGAEVVCADVDVQGAEATASSIEGGGATSRKLDVTSRADIDSAVEQLGPVDILVATPGINVRKPILETSDEEIEKVIDVNLKGAYRLIRGFGEGMCERGSGSIIAFASFRAVTVEPGQGMYAATKAGIVQLVRVAADEFGERNVRVNSVAPGTVETPLTEQIKSDPDWYEAYRRKSILKRWAQPSEMVGAMIWLASDASSYVTGSLVMLDGGWTAADGRFRPGGSAKS